MSHTYTDKNHYHVDRGDGKCNICLKEFPKDSAGTADQSPISSLKVSLLDGMPAAERKTYPIITGCLDYFPDALLMVSHVSYVGNIQHNGVGAPLHWARGKSTDEDDAEGRHIIGRGTFDDDKILHSAKRAWRALAVLQKELERTYGIAPPRGTIDPRAASSTSAAAEATVRKNPAGLAYL